MAWSEASLHDWLRQRAKPQGLVGSQGHDGAILRARAERTVLCTDACVEGVHFESRAPAAQVGAKAAARALSDLAACGAQPRALLLALRAPKSTSEKRLRGLIQAVDRCGRIYGAPLVGGDLTAAPGPLSLTVSAQGGLPGRSKPVGRDRAEPGQLVLLTGPVGGSLLGRHLRIEPRVAEGQFFFAAGATVLMDVSDGLALDLERIARASGVQIELGEIPLHRDARRRARQTGRPAWEHALTDGEDHELIATISPARWKAIRARAMRRFPKLHVLGEVHTKAANDPFLSAEDPQLGHRIEQLRSLGWQHGG